MDASRLDDAVLAFERAVAELPGYAPAHAGLANGYLLQYERTRYGSAPDLPLLKGAMEAARRATALEPDNWRHQYRLAYGSWGEERLRAVDRTLSMMPTFAPARMLSSMDFVARGTLDRAEREATLGAEMQRQHQDAHTPLPAVGFHWLLGMIVAARGDRASALACFDEEIVSAARHVYGREFAVNANIAAGFLRFQDGDIDGAAQAFGKAGAHPKARVGMLAIDHDRQGVDAAIAALASSERHAEAALVMAGAHLVSGDVASAGAALDRLLASAPPGPAGWIIPIDPMLSGIHAYAGKQALFAKLAARAA